MTSFRVDRDKMKSVEQVTTVPVTIESIMCSPYFALGAADQRAGRGYRGDYATWCTNDQWNYERGRTWAVLTPRSVALRCNGKLNRAAVRWYEDIL
jgi:hypothetical protein